MATFRNIAESIRSEIFSDLDTADLGHLNPVTIGLAYLSLVDQLSNLDAKDVSNLIESGTPTVANGPVQTYAFRD